MDAQDLQSRVAEASRTIYTWCLSRTSHPQDAEDLAQDIAVELLRSLPGLRDEAAFYGFMWSVARHVYSAWLKKKRRTDCEALPEELSAPDPDPDGDGTELHLLRRELALLAEKYRRAAVLYYIDGQSCAEIAQSLQTSQSMVKYLLFKARIKLKEGMQMERIYGEQSYHPCRLTMSFWGGNNMPYMEVRHRLIAQNILFACYNDRLTPKEISLQIGVALPYMEKDLEELEELELLRKEGKRYTTNMVIFTRELSMEIDTKTVALRRRIADRVKEAVLAKAEAVRRIGFMGADMPEGVFAWQMSCMLLYSAIIDKLQNSVQLTYPRDKFGTPLFIWGNEESQGKTWKDDVYFGISNASNERGYVQFMDFPIHGELVHNSFYDRLDFVNVFLSAAGKGVSLSAMSENDRAIAAELVRKGYITREMDCLRVHAPVFTREQHARLLSLLEEDTTAICAMAQEVMDAVAAILQEQLPSHLRPLHQGMAYLRLFDDAISAPVAMLMQDGFLRPAVPGEMLPTTYIILHE